MLFGSKTTLHPSNAILNSFMQSGEMKTDQGFVSIERKDGRKTIQEGRIFFRNELVYAAIIDTRPIPIAARVITGNKVDPQEVSAIVNRCGSPYSADVIRQLLVNNLISERSLDAYVKEHFLDNLAEILSWQDCVGKWYPGESTKDFTMPNVSLPRLRQIVAGREAKREEFIKEVSRFFREDEFDHMTFLNTSTNDESFSAEVKAILALCDGHNKAVDIYEATGIGLTAVGQTIHLLWKRGDLSLKYGAIELTYASAMLSNAPKEEAVQEETVQDNYIDAESDEEQLEVASDEPHVEELDAEDESLLAEEEVDLSDAPLEQNDESEINEAKTDEPDFDEDGSLVVEYSYPEDVNEVEELPKIVDDIKSKYDIHDVDFEHDDAVDIDPVYVDTSVNEVVVENEVENYDTEIESEENDESENSTDESPTDEDNGEQDVAEEAISEVDAPVEEVAVEEIVDEPEEAEAAEEAPARSIGELMALLGRLNDEEKLVGTQIEEVTTKEAELATEIAKSEQSLATVKEEAERLEQECDALREQYEKSVGLLKQKYEEATTLDAEINAKREALDETASEAEKLREKKETIITKVEETTRSFSMR